jgi:DNA-repair protein complementing XP-A cells
MPEPPDNHPLNVSRHESTEHDGAELASIETALEVERLDVNLFRSKSLHVPYRSRGVFGGQVISQAIVSATNCVKPEYSLHVGFFCISPGTDNTEIPVSHFM